MRFQYHRVDGRGLDQKSIYDYFSDVGATNVYDFGDGIRFKVGDDSLYILKSDFDEDMDDDTGGGDVLDEDEEQTEEQKRLDQSRLSSYGRFNAAGPGGSFITDIRTMGFREFADKYQRADGGRYTSATNLDGMIRGVYGMLDRQGYTEASRELREAYTERGWKK